MPRVIEVRVQLSAEELYRATLEVRKRYASQRTGLQAVSLFLGITFCGLAAFDPADLVPDLHFGVEDNWLRSMLARMTVWGTVGGLFFIVWRRVLARVGRQEFGRWPGVTRPVHHVLDEKGIKTRSELTSSEISWDALHEAVETPTDFVLVLDTSYGIILPKRCFDPPGSIAELRLLLELVAGPRAKLRWD